MGIQGCQKLRNYPLDINNTYQEEEEVEEEEEED